MMRLALIFGVAALSACNMTAPAGGGATGGGGMRERLVLGSNMSFDQCQAAGGLIIQDAGSPMVACDPRVRRRVATPADEFKHPSTNSG